MSFGEGTGIDPVGIKNTIDIQIDPVEKAQLPTSLTASGNLKVSIEEGGAGNGAILDGVNSAIKATVLDYTNSNPLAVRLTDTNGDYVGAGAGTEYTEDAVAPADPIGKAIVVTRDDVLSTVTEAEGDWSRLRGTAEGALWVQDFNSDDILADLASIDGKITACNTGAVVISSALPAGANTIGSVKITDGVETASINASNQLEVAVGNTATITGDIAHDAADSGNPVKIGHKAVLFDGSAPPNAAAAENDRVNSISDEYGRQYVETTHPNFWSVTANYSAAQTNTSIKAAPGVGLSLYITDIIVSNGATAGNVKFVEDTGGTPIDKVEVMYFAINGGAALHFRTPIKLSANVDFGITSATVTTHSVVVNGFIAP